MMANQTDKARVADTALTETRDQILLAVLDNVAFDGWTVKAFEQASRMLGIDQTAIDAAFPEGMTQVLDHLADWADRQALAVMDAASLDDMRVRDRITLAVRARLEALAPHKDAVRRSFALVPRPAYGGQIPNAVWRSADRFWIKAGDTATDYNHYTKRLLLSGVIISTTLFWLNDRSVDQAPTWVFLDRRIDNVLTLGKQFGRFKPVFDTAEKAAKAAKAPRKLADRVVARFRPGVSDADPNDGPNAPSSEAVH